MNLKVTYDYTKLQASTYLFVTAHYVCNAAFIYKIASAIIGTDSLSKRQLIWNLPMNSLNFENTLKKAQVLFGSDSAFQRLTYVMHATLLFTVAHSLYVTYSNFNDYKYSQRPSKPFC